MKTLATKLTLSVAAGALLMTTAHAQTMMQGDTAMSGTMSTTTGEMMMPTAVSGTVLRYYVDAAGYVTAMDVQTADGVRMVRFDPSMAQRLTMTYPVGQPVSVYVSSMPMGRMTRYDLVSVGDTMPTMSTNMMTRPVSTVDFLRAMPYIQSGAERKRYTGELTGYISDPDTSEVLAIVLDDETLVRVPRENRLPQASPSPEGVVPLLKGASVEVYGYPEAPRYGVVSPYQDRVVGTGISVNGRTLGPFGFGSVASSRRKGLFNFNLNLPLVGNSPDTSMAAEQGYMEYRTQGNMEGGMMDGGMAGQGTTGTMEQPAAGSLEAGRTTNPTTMNR